MFFVVQPLAVLFLEALRLGRVKARKLRRQLLLCFSLVQVTVGDQPQLYPILGASHAQKREDLRISGKEHSVCRRQSEDDGGAPP